MVYVKWKRMVYVKSSKKYILIFLTQVQSVLYTEWESVWRAVFKSYTRMDPCKFFPLIKDINQNEFSK